MSNVLRAFVILLVAAMLLGSFGPWFGALELFLLTGAVVAAICLACRDA